MPFVPKELPNVGGTVLADRYEVICEMGRGGMGMVFLCKDLITGEKVALKRLRLTEAEGESKSRSQENWWFQQESRAVASLDHPAVVRARDFGILSDGSPYLVMDALPGRSLHEWMHTTSIPWSVAWVMADHVFAGLAHAHARGVIHGDLKPSNILLDLTSHSKGPRAFILDLGLAWLRESRRDPRLDGEPAPELTTHAGAGTVGWVAPEQIRKAATLVGPPTDLYALGCILYRVLVGHEVFVGSAEEVLRAHKRTPVLPPVLAEGVPAEVAPFIVRLLAKKPWHRFDYAADARAVWRQFKPPDVFALDEWAQDPPVAQFHPSSQAPDGDQENRLVVLVGRSLTPGILHLRSSPLVARETERTELLGMVDELLSHKGEHQKIVMLTGEAGIGKSRIAEWLCEYVHERGTMWVLRARYGKMPSALDGLTGAINKFYHLQGADRILVERTLISRWEIDKNDDQGLTWVAATAEWLRPSPLGREVPLGPSGKRFSLDTPELRFFVVRRVLEYIGQTRPILIWLDDLHLSSKNTFDVIKRLKHEARHLRIFMVATARSEVLESDVEASSRMEDLRANYSGKVIKLRPLNESDTGALLKSTLPLHQQAVRVAIRQSRGNPLFALQLLHAWAIGGHLQIEGGQYMVSGDALQGRAITTTELWDERLRAMPSHLKFAAHAAAALGDDVRGLVFSALMTDLGFDANEAISSLTRAQILLSTGPDQFRWAHALLQEHLLARLLEHPDSRTIFRRASHVLALHPMSGGRRIMKHRVVNLLRAQENDQAAELMFYFVEEAWVRGRDAAATLKDLALLDGKVSGLLFAKYQYWKAEALRHADKLDEAKECILSALGLFEQLKERVKWAQALRLFGDICSVCGAFTLGKENLELSIELFEGAEHEKERAQALVVLGEIYYFLGRYKQAQQMAAMALLICNATGDKMSQARAFILRSMIFRGMGRTLSASKLLMKARENLDAVGYRLGIAQCDLEQGKVDLRARNMSSARNYTNQALAAFCDLLNNRGAAACELLLAQIAFDIGDDVSSQMYASKAETRYASFEDKQGLLEAKLLCVQLVLVKKDMDVKTFEMLQTCDRIELEGIESKQHKHLTWAWYWALKNDPYMAVCEVDLAKSVLPDIGRAADHTQRLLHRIYSLVSPKTTRATHSLAERITTWLNELEPPKVVMMSASPQPRGS